MSRDFLSGLAKESAAQVVKFIRFFNSKREILVAAVAAEFEESADLLHDDEYSRAEVKRNVLAPLGQSLKLLVRDEHTTVVNMVVLLLKQVFESAEEQGCTLDLDMGAVEDAALLEEVAQVRVEARAATGNEGESKHSAASPAKLTTLKDDHVELVRANHRLQADAEAMAEQCAAARRESAALADQVRRLEAALERGSSSSSSGSGGGWSESAAQAKEDEHARALAFERSALAEAKGGLEARTAAQAKAEHEASRLREDLRRAEDDANTRLSSSSQMAQMRRLLQQKNEMVASLRQRLARYEPDDSGPDANDD